ncbi:MAG: hypothetical protein L6Q38_17290 [Nitrospira sp.]|nr:hypothetical protein [Nitrospira sp.]MCK6556868.1 hypothetical protein [Candidatus Binatia bacterium]
MRSGKGLHAVLTLPIGVAVALLLPAIGMAAIEEIDASARFHLGDNDTKLDGHRLALMQAKRTALEKAGTYVESISEVKDFQLTRDEIRTYSAGILSVEETQEPKWEMVGRNLEVTVYVRVRVDRDDVARKIATLRKDKDATLELKEARQKQLENERKIADLNKKLRKAKKGAPATERAKVERSEAMTDFDTSTLMAQAAVAKRFSANSYDAAKGYFQHNIVPAAGACYHNLKPKGQSAQSGTDNGLLVLAAPALALAIRTSRMKYSEGKQKEGS